MERNVTPTEWRWILCTRTKAEDYFWLDNTFKKIGTPELYSRVGDESSQRTGYFLIAHDTIEMGVGNLDSERQDRFGRRIQHVLLLRTKLNNMDEVRLLRELFAEAIGGTSSDPVAATLARTLYENWENRQEAGESAGCDWLGLVSKPTIPAEMVSTPCLEPRRQYSRTPDTLRRIAATALSTCDNMLLLCAATKPVGNIWPIPSLSNVPAVLCSSTVKNDGSPLLAASSHAIGHRTVTGGDVADLLDKGVRKTAKHATNIANKLLKHKLLLGLIVIAVVILAYALLLRQPVQEPVPAKPETAVVHATAQSDVTSTGTSVRAAVGTPAYGSQPVAATDSDDVFSSPDTPSAMPMTSESPNKGVGP